MIEETLNIVILIGLYIIFFVFYTFLKTESKLMDRIIFCSVCFTWASILLLSIFFSFQLPIIALLLGISIGGLSYNLSDFFKDKKKFITSHFFVLLLMTIVGLILVTYIL
jgi:hypothetical protein